MPALQVSLEVVKLWSRVACPNSQVPELSLESCVKSALEENRKSKVRVSTSCPSQAYCRHFCESVMCW